MVTRSLPTLTIGEESTKTPVLLRPYQVKNSYQELEQLYLFVFLTAWQMLHGKSNDTRDAAQDLTQKAFCKYCRVVKYTTITYPRAYLRKTLHSLMIDDARHPHEELSLETDEQGEPVGNVINGGSEEDPAELVYQNQVFNDWLEQIIPDILALSTGQWHALVCHMKEKVDDLQTLTLAFQRHGVNIAGIHWPTDKKALQSSRSLLCLAQKKMRLLKPSYSHLF